MESKEFSKLILEFELLVLKSFDHSYIGHNSISKKNKTTWILIKFKNSTIGGITYNNSGYIDYLCVHPDFRKQGIGRWLIEIVLDEITYSENRVVPYLYIDYEPTKIQKMAKLLIFYRRLGFKLHNITKNSLCLVSTLVY